MVYVFAGLSDCQMRGSNKILNSAQNGLCFCRVARFHAFLVAIVALRIAISLVIPDDSVQPKQNARMDFDYFYRYRLFLQTICSRGHKPLRRLGTLSHCLFTQSFVFDRRFRSSKIWTKMVYVFAGLRDSWLFREQLMAWQIAISLVFPDDLPPPKQKRLCVF